MDIGYNPAVTAATSASTPQAVFIPPEVAAVRSKLKETVGNERFIFRQVGDSQKHIFSCFHSMGGKITTIKVEGTPEEILNIVIAEVLKKSSE